MISNAKTILVAMAISLFVSWLVHASAQPVDNLHDTDKEEQEQLGVLQGLNDLLAKVLDGPPKPDGWEDVFDVYDGPDIDLSTFADPRTHGSKNTGITGDMYDKLDIIIEMLTLQHQYNEDLIHDIRNLDDKTKSEDSDPLTENAIEDAVEKLDRIQYGRIPDGYSDDEEDKHTIERLIEEATRNDHKSEEDIANELFEEIFPNSDETDPLHVLQGHWDNNDILEEGREWDKRRLEMCVKNADSILSKICKRILDGTKQTHTSVDEIMDALNNPDQLNELMERFGITQEHFHDEL